MSDFMQKHRLGKTVVFTNGCFDILHIGHVRYLQEARSHGDLLIVGLNSDSGVRLLNKGTERPLQHEEDRAQILLALECVDHVILFSDPTPIKLIEALSPDVLVKGGDWSVDQIVGSKHVLDSGGVVKSLGFVQGRSTTGIVEKIKSTI